MIEKNIKFTILLPLLAGIIFFSGCSVASTKGSNFPRIYEEKPITILALPPINETTSPVAKEYVVCTITEPLGSTGYYLLPIAVSNEILKREGLYDTEVIDPEVYPRFKELFDVDALLFTRIFKWDTSYYVVGGEVTVGLAYNLVSTITGETLWSYYGEKTVDTTQKSDAGGLAGLLISVAATAVSTATTDYIPIARDINKAIFETLPRGKYSVRHGLDQNDPVQKK